MVLCLGDVSIVIAKVIVNVSGVVRVAMSVGMCCGCDCDCEGECDGVCACGPDGSCCCGRVNVNANYERVCVTMIVNVSAGSCGAIALVYVHAVVPMSANVVVRVNANAIVDTSVYARASAAVDMKVSLWIWMGVFSYSVGFCCARLLRSRQRVALALHLGPPWAKCCETKSMEHTLLTHNSSFVSASCSWPGAGCGSAAMTCQTWSRP